MTRDWCDRQGYSHSSLRAVRLLWCIICYSLGRRKCEHVKNSLSITFHSFDSNSPSGLSPMTQSRLIRLRKTDILIVADGFARLMECEFCIALNEHFPPTHHVSGVTNDQSGSRLL